MTNLILVLHRMSFTLDPQMNESREGPGRGHSPVHSLDLTQMSRHPGRTGTVTVTSPGQGREEHVSKTRVGLCPGSARPSLRFCSVKSLVELMDSFSTDH